MIICKLQMGNCKVKHTAQGYMALHWWSHHPDPGVELGTWVQPLDDTGSVGCAT